jgi:FUS-interacting serine-arginine-rich protein 1
MCDGFGKAVFTNIIYFGNPYRPVSPRDRRYRDQSYSRSPYGSRSYSRSPIRSRSLEYSR